MKPLIVLDACTILNLLRIDDEDSDFLLNLILNWRPSLPETVVSEAKLHVRSSFYSKEKNDHILIAINREFDHLKTMNYEIKKDLGDVGFDDVIKFSDHNRRENGELYCVALALIKSREEDATVTVYTDDYKAIDEFHAFYRYHQIGHMEDTLDLLTLLYWSTPESIFQYGLYLSFLENLRAEYCHQLNILAETIISYLEQKKKSKCSDRDLLENLNKIVTGYRKSDMAQLEAGVCFFQVNNRYKEVKKIVENVNVKNINHQMERITKHFKQIKNYLIFKVA